MTSEEVLVVPRARLFLHGPFHGLRREGLPDYLQAIRAYGVFRRRDLVEDDPSWKQIIPYLVVRRKHEIFLFRRLDQGEEARLAGRYSIGVGGHINRSDVEGAQDPIVAGLRRELCEELSIEGPWRAALLGVLNDDTEPVGQVHFGLVYLVDVGRSRVSVREVDRLEGDFVPVDELGKYREGMESWSRLILSHPAKILKRILTG
jgi:predicted NUDIX family phosphoesterase